MKLTAYWKDRYSWKSLPVTSKAGLLPTPPPPADLPPVELTENARQVLMKRYVRRGDDGKPCETVEEMFWRVAWHVAKVEELWQEDVDATRCEYYQLLSSKKFFPNSPTFTGAGTPLGQLAACFVLPITDDMGKDSAGIFQTLRDAALIQQTGGGNGFSFSRLRPMGSLVKSSAGQATGPVGFLRVYDHAFGEIAQGGTRRGANMAVLRVDHPDIESFITCKTNENAITNFNISVGITDAFMQAVEDGRAIGIWSSRISPAPEYRKFKGNLNQASQAGIPLIVHKTIKARELYSTRSSPRRTTTANRACSSWMPPTAPTLFHTYTHSKPPTHAVNNGWDPTRTAVWDPSTWRNISVRDGTVDWEELRHSVVTAVQFPG